MPSMRAIIVYIKDTVGILYSIAAISAIIAGGLWAYLNFSLQRNEYRVAYPAADIKQNLTSITFDNGRRLLIVGIYLRNIGKVRIDIKRGDIWVQQILPITSCIDGKSCAKAEIAKAASDAKRMNDTFSWEGIATRDIEKQITLEPSEEQHHEYEFIIPSEVRVVRIHSWFKNERFLEQNLFGWPFIENIKHDQPIGWTASSYYSLGGEK